MNSHGMVHAQLRQVGTRDGDFQEVIPQGACEPWIIWADAVIVLNDHAALREGCYLRGAMIISLE